MLRRKEVIIVGKSKVVATNAEQRGIGPKTAAPPNTSLTFTSENKVKDQHESHFATEPEAQKRDDTTGPEAQKHDDMKVDANGGYVQMDNNKDDLLDDYDIYGDLQ